MFKDKLDLGGDMPTFDDDDFSQPTTATPTEQLNTTSQVSMVVGGTETIAPSKRREWENQ